MKPLFAPLNQEEIGISYF